jgi:dephospho-CoA kinase
MARWKHGRPKPVIGIVGGIGSGKSTVSRLFKQARCAVIDSDELAHEVVELPVVKEELRNWLGDAAFRADGSVNRKALGAIVFSDAGKIRRLGEIIHPLVGQRRAELMRIYMADPGIRAVVWDTPLLVEAGLDKECDAVVFVKVPMDLRRKRVREKRGWTAEELEKREKLQFPLDKKAEIADYCVDNSGDEASSLVQVQRVVSQLLPNSEKTRE